MIRSVLGISPMSSISRWLPPSRQIRAISTTVPNPHHDVIILGTGAFGSSAAYHLSLQGARVLALDMHPPGHAWGSSHGHTRIFRLAYFEVRWAKIE